MLALHSLVNDMKITSWRMVVLKIGRYFFNFWTIYNVMATDMSLICINKFFHHFLKSTWSTKQQI